MQRFSLRVINGVPTQEIEGPNACDDQRLFDKLLHTGLFKVIEPTLTDVRPLVDELLDTHSSGFMWVDCGYTAVDEGTLLTAPNQAAPYIGGDALGWYCRGFLPVLLHRLLLREETTTGDTMDDTAVRLRWFAVRSYNESVVDLIGPFLPRAPYEEAHSLRHLTVRQVWDFMQHVQYVIATPSFSLARGRISHVFWITSRGISYVVCVIHEMHMEMINVVLQPTADLRGQQEYPLSFLSTMHAVKVGLALNEQLFRPSTRNRVNGAEDQLRWCIRVGSHQKADPLGIQGLLPNLRDAKATTMPVARSASHASDAQHSNNDYSENNTKPSLRQQYQQAPPPPPLSSVAIHQDGQSKPLNKPCTQVSVCSAPVSDPAPGFRMERLKQSRRAHCIRSITAVSTRSGSSFGSSETTSHSCSSLPIQLCMTAARAEDRIRTSPEVGDHSVTGNRFVSSRSKGGISSVPTLSRESSHITSNKWSYPHATFTSASSNGVFHDTYSEDPISFMTMTKGQQKQQQQQQQQERQQQQGALTNTLTCHHDAVEAQFSRICELWVPELPLERHVTTSHGRVEGYKSRCKTPEMAEHLSNWRKEETNTKWSDEITIDADWCRIETQLSKRCELESLEATARSELEGDFYASLTNLCLRHALAMRVLLCDYSSEPLEIALRETQEAYAAAQQEWATRAAQQAHTLFQLETAVAVAEAKHTQRQSEAATEKGSFMLKKAKHVRPLTTLQAAVQRESVRVLQSMYATLSEVSHGENSFGESSAMGYACEGSKPVARQETPAALKAALKTALENFCHLPLQSTKHQSARSPRGHSVASQRSQSPPVRWSRAMLAEVRETCEAHRMLCVVLEKRRSLADEAQRLTKLCHKEEQAVRAAREEVRRERQAAWHLSEIVTELEKIDKETIH